MIMNSRKPILVTGSHRSGSTWVGRMIAECPKVVYIHEPFNISHHDPGICGAKFQYWFTYVSEENGPDFYKHIKNTCNFSYNLAGKLKQAKYAKGISRIIGTQIKWLTYRFSKVRPLIKDPIAIMSADWLASKFNMNVLILIRHPSAFVSSLKKTNWSFPFSHFLKQPLLMNSRLYPFEAEIRTFAKKKQDIIDQAVLLWKIIHYMIIKYRAEHRDWIFIRHEDLSQDPLHCFRILFDKLNLEFSQQIANVIREHSYPSTATEPASTHSIRRDSRSNILNWKKILTKNEIKRIRTQVEGISSAFYVDQDW